MKSVRSLPKDDGAALVMAALFIGVWAVVIFAILAFTEAGFNLAAGSADQRELTYAANGGVQAAIFATTSYLTDGGDPVDCPDMRFSQGPWDDGSEVFDIFVSVSCVDTLFAPSWFPYEAWGVFIGEPVEWLDDPIDDTPSGDEGDLYDWRYDPGSDIQIVTDVEAGPYGDINGNGVYDAGEPTSEPQLQSGAMNVLAANCDPGDSPGECDLVVQAFLRIDLTEGDPEVTTEHWNVNR